MEKNYWIELIGFDKDNIKDSVADFIYKQQGRVDSIFLLLTDVDFINDYAGLKTEYRLKRCECSYSGHLYNNERKLQNWTNFDLKNLIDEFHTHNVKVFCSVFASCHGLNDDGKMVSTSTEANHPELNEFSSKVYAPWKGTVHVLKRFNDGTFFEDYFAKNLKACLSEYGFDGMHLADGLTSGRQRVVNSDFSDDMVEQFVNFTGIKLPDNIPLKATSKKAHQFRYKYIINNLRYEWSIFFAKRFGNYFKKICDAVHEVGKLVYFNNCWTCSPFEALFRYGIDYKEFIKAKPDAMMFEDVGGNNTVLTYQSLEILIPEERRMHNELRYMLTQNALKLATNMKIVNMTTLQDTQEQWNFIENDITEFRNYIARRGTSLVVDDNGNYVRACQGSTFCLSDGLSKNVWDTVHSVQEHFYLPKIKEDLTFTVVLPEDINSEVKNFIADRKYYSELFYLEMIMAGANVSSMVAEHNIANSRGPIMLFADSITDKNAIAFLNNCNDRLILIAGYKDIISKKPSAIFKSKDFSVKIYNAKNSADKKYADYKETNHSIEDTLNCHYPKEARHDIIPKKLFADAQAFIDREGIMPVLLYPYQVKDFYMHAGYGPLPKENCRMALYKINDNKAIMVVFNLNNYYSAPCIKMPFAFKSVKMLGKPDWHEVSVFKDNIILFQLTQRNAEILEFTL